MKKITKSVDCTCVTVFMCSVHPLVLVMPNAACVPLECTVCEFCPSYQLLVYVRQKNHIYFMQLPDFGDKKILDSSNLRVACWPNVPQPLTDVG